jgi:transposase-like protein
LTFHGKIGVADTNNKGPSDSIKSLMPNLAKIDQHDREVDKEIKRRTRVAIPFPNEASLLRLVSAFLMKTSEKWEARNRYLKLEADPILS